MNDDEGRAMTRTEDVTPARDHAQNSRRWSGDVTDIASDEQRHDWRVGLRAWAARHGIVPTVELVERVTNLDETTGVSETWKATIITDAGEIGVRTVTDGSYEPKALDVLFGAWRDGLPEVDEVSAFIDAVGSEAAADLFVALLREARDCLAW